MGARLLGSLAGGFGRGIDGAVSVVARAVGRASDIALLAGGVSRRAARARPSLRDYGAAALAHAAGLECCQRRDAGSRRGGGGILCARRRSVAPALARSSSASANSR